MILGRIINRLDFCGFGKRNISNLFSLNSIITIKMGQGVLKS